MMRIEIALQGRADGVTTIRMEGHLDRTLVPGETLVFKVIEVERRTWISIPQDTRR